MIPWPSVPACLKAKHSFVSIVDEGLEDFDVRDMALESSMRVAQSLRIRSPIFIDDQCDCSSALPKTAPTVPQAGTGPALRASLVGAQEMNWTQWSASTTPRLCTVRWRLAKSRAFTTPWEF